jgi:hypothetical protein
MQILFNNEELDDVICVISFINDYTKALNNLNVVIDPKAIERIIRGCRQDFPHDGGVSKASGFKQVANFVCHFVAERPLVESFALPDEELMKIDNHQNAMVAFALAESALNHSRILKTTGEEVVCIAIDYSRHSYIDIIEALSTVTPMYSFKLVTVLFEQLVYKSNPNCQYKTVGSITS